MQTNRWKGETYGVPYSGGAWGLLYYNADHFEEVGLDSENPLDAVKTWPDFMDTARQLKDVATPVGMLGTTEALPAQWSGFYFTSGAESWLNGDKTKSILDQDKGVATAKLYKDLVDEGLTPKGTANTNGSDVAELMGSGEISMYQVGSWQAAYFDQNYPDFNYGITYCPRMKGGRSSAMAGGWNQVINKQSENKEGARKLLAHLSSKEAHTSLIPAPAGRKDATEEFFNGFTDGLGREVGDIVIDQYENSAPRPVHPSYPGMSTEFQKQMQRLIIGEATPKEAMTKTSEEINSLL